MYDVGCILEINTDVLESTNFFVGFWITILENTDVYFKSVFLAIDLFSIIAIRSVISLEIN